MSQLAFTKFPSGWGAGLAVVAAFSIISTIGVAFFLLRAIWVSVYPLLSPSAQRKPSQESVFFHTQLGIYASNLLLGNLLFSFAGAMNISWAMQDGITENVSCTSQAILMQTGNLLTAYFLVTIAIHTVSSLIFGRRQPLWVSGIVVVVGWAAALLIAVLPANTLVPGLGPFYGDAGYWCWITDDYLSARFYLHYLFVFLAGIISAILYSVLFLTLRGTLHIRNGFSFSLNPNKRWNGRVGTSDEYRRFIHSIARSMLWYPVGYIVCFAPITACNILQMSEYQVPFGFWMFSAIFAVLQGIVNVIILYNTIRVLRPAFTGMGTSQRSLDVESGSSGEKSLFSEKSQFGLYGQGPAPFLATQSSSRSSTWSNPSTRVLQQPKITHQRSFSSFSTASSGSENTVKGGHARNASYAASIGRSITPTSQLDRRILESPQDAVAKANPIAPPRLRVVTGEHQRQGSSDSLALPPAPRRSRSPIQRYPSTHERVSPPDSQTSSTSFHGPLLTPKNERHESLHSMYQDRTTLDSDRFSMAPLPALPKLPDAVKRKPSMLRNNALSPVESSPSDYSNQSAVSPNFGHSENDQQRPPTQYAEYSPLTEDYSRANTQVPHSAFGSYKSSHSHLQRKLSYY